MVVEEPCSWHQPSDEKSEMCCIEACWGWLSMNADVKGMEWSAHRIPSSPHSSGIDMGNHVLVEQTTLKKEGIMARLIAMGR